MFKKRYTIIAKNKEGNTIKKRLYARNGDTAKTTFYKAFPEATIKIFKRRRNEKIYIALKWTLLGILFLIGFAYFLYYVAKRTALHH